MVAACTLARGFTAPGQTIGISPFIDHFVDALGTSRSVVSTMYLIGTLVGAAALPFIGRWLDRVGVRHTMTLVTIGFSLAILFASTVQHVALLAVAFVGLRMLGQGALTTIANQGIVLWFEQRRGFALAIAGMGTLALLSVAPLIFTGFISAFGWRVAMVISAVGVAATLLPVARFVIVDRPEDADQVPDGTAEQMGTEVRRGRSYTLTEAARVPALWTLCAITALAGAVVTGLTFHNVDLLGERGFSETQAAAIFLPQLVGGATASFVIGWATDRYPGRLLIFLSGVFLAIGTFLATITSPGAMAIVYGVVLGLAAGSTGATFSALLPKWFGVDHIGSIKGTATTLNVIGSAIGPLVLSLGNDAADSYSPVVVGCAVVCAAIAALTLIVPTPDAAT